MSKTPTFDELAWAKLAEHVAPEDLRTVVDQLHANMPTLAGRWSDLITNYPPQLVVLLVPEIYRLVRAYRAAHA